MKRARTGTFTKAERPVMPGQHRAAPATGVNRRLTAAERKEVKLMIQKAAPKSITHNSAVAGVAPVTGTLASAATSVLAFTATNAGLGENQRRGDQIWIDKIAFRGYVSSTAAMDHVRFLVVRAPRGANPPVAIDPTALLQNAGAGTPGIISSIQDDQPYTVLYDKVIKAGNGTVTGFATNIIEFNLDFSKRPLRCVYFDNSATGGVSQTIEGDIELICATHSAGLATLTYAYDVTFHEK